MKSVVLVLSEKEVKLLLDRVNIELEQSDCYEQSDVILLKQIKEKLEKVGK